MNEKYIEANGLRFSYLEQGVGPLVLMLHGFPDNAWSWEHQIPYFANAGYRVVAPNLRGYSPSQIPEQPYYDRASLAEDVRGLILALNDGEPCFLVAQDWGAALSYGALALYPELIKRAVLMAIPHPDATSKSLGDPEQIHRAFHWWYFQIPDLPEKTVPMNDYAFIDYLWNYWSPGHHDAPHIARVKQTLSQPGALSAAIGYYRAAFNPAYRDPALGHLWTKLGAKIGVPTLALCGADDIRAGPMSSQAEFFAAEYRYQEVPDCGHFLHRERPDLVNELVLEWLRMDCAG